jgi:exodeoxyribonuclease V alpha subunit
VVVIPLAMQQYLLLQRNLIYSGITRGKKLVVLIRQPNGHSLNLNLCRAITFLGCHWVTLRGTMK